MAHTKPYITKVSCMQPVFEHYTLAVTLSCVRKPGSLPSALFSFIHTFASRCGTVLSHSPISSRRWVSSLPHMHPVLPAYYRTLLDVLSQVSFMHSHIHACHHLTFVLVSHFM